MNEPSGRRWIDGRSLRALGNDHYHGSALSWPALAAFGVFNLGRGGIHFFKADGGAGSIAGIDLSMNHEVILSLFATMGLTQMLLGVIDLAVALRYRALVPMLLAYHLLHSIGAAFVLWVWRPFPVDAPGKFGVIPIALILALFFLLSLRRPSAERG